LFDMATHKSVFYTLSLHDALPISDHLEAFLARGLLPDVHDLRAQARIARHEQLADAVVARPRQREAEPLRLGGEERVRQLDQDADRKSTRLNSSHVKISYAVFCLK